MKIALHFMLLFAGIPFFVGCAREPIVQVSGTILKKGAVVKAGEGIDVQVVFVGIDKKGQPQSFTGSVQGDSGIFYINGSEGGIPPGSYKILVNHTSTKGNFDLLAGPKTAAPLLVTIPANPSRQEFTIDVDKRTAQPKA
jgi:hypothetical protein